MTAPRKLNHPEMTIVEFYVHAFDLNLMQACTSAHTCILNYCELDYSSGLHSLANTFTNALPSVSVCGMIQIPSFLMSCWFVGSVLPSCHTLEYKITATL